jgi:hypothetical protein
MKYYNFNGSLVVELTAGLEVQCVLEKVEVEGSTFDKLYASFTFSSPYFQDNPLQKIPLSKQQATRLYLHFKEREYPYRNCCEIWWRLKKHCSDDHVMENALLTMTEMALDMPKTVKVERFFWQKVHFTFAYN